MAHPRTNCWAFSKLSLAAFVFCFSASLSSAQATDDGDAAMVGCSIAVGTYLTTRVNQSAQGEEHTGRSLFSFTNGGHAFLSDSAQGGVEGFQPFSDGRGVWRCTADENDKIEISALILDFTYPTNGKPDPQIARLDIKASYDDTSKEITGKTMISFTALDGDPMDRDALKNPIGYTFTGKKINLDN